MGLDIHSKSSELSYHFSYGGLHNIRLLAVRLMSEDDTLDRSSVITDTFSWGYALAASRFKNLMLHSDCEGSYTQKGKVDFNKKGLLTGNLPELCSELSIIRKAVKKGTVGKDGVGVDELETLYKLAIDVNKKGGFLTLS